MKIWLVMTGEPLEMFGERPHRIGILSKMLVERGHQVTWWTTAFDHQHKKYLFDENKMIKSEFGVDMFFLYPKTQYKKNISLQRIINHKEVANQFAKEAKNKNTPDLILCCYPTIDTAMCAVDFGRDKNIPVVVDIRDLWPDIFIDYLPRGLRFFGRLALLPYFLRARFIFKNSYSVIAVSKKYLNWSRKYGSKINHRNKVFPLGYLKSSDFDCFALEIKKFAKMGIENTKTIIWFSGTFGKTYDLSVVIDAAEQLKNKKDVLFVFTGDGENSERWKNRVKEKGLHNIIFTGWVNRKELNYLASISSIGLMAYKKGAPQGLPNKVFEYFAYGLPVLSSLETETRELLEKHKVGLSYDADNVNDLVRKTKKLVLDKKKITQMSDNAFCLYKKKYSAEFVYSKLAEYLERTTVDYFEESHEPIN